MKCTLIHLAVLQVCYGDMRHEWNYRTAIAELWQGPHHIENRSISG
ncbi:MAG: hypothetical protein QE279_09150 [Rhodoferax sp.]|nr:hypothetical protein [Rhodoferax sp.]